MIREVNLEEISDGKLYGANDMVKADCNDCQGCSACCHGMGNSVVLDPLDIHRLVAHLHVDFETLLQGRIELHVVDGIILPNLRMAGEQEACSFLNENGRCSIHPFRPGICRLFPLGRFYEDRSFRYFLQVHECQKENRTKVKVRKWIDTPDLRKNEQFVADWHYFLKDMQEQIASGPNEELAKQVSMYVLKTFYMTPFDCNRDFYEQFERRLNVAKELFMRKEQNDV